MESSGKAASQSGAITPWVPLFLFTFLFGISMDYHVFILSRIRELLRPGETTAYDKAKLDLELLESKAFNSGAVYVRYQVV